MTLLVVSLAACDVATAPRVAVPALGAIHGPWSPVPVPLPDPILAAADRACRGSMLPFPDGVQIVVVDARGEGILQLAYAGPNGGMAQCDDMTVDAQGRVHALGGGSTGQGVGPLPVVPPNTLEPGGSSSSGDPVTKMTTIGRAGEGVAAVRILIPGQPPITASFANGWYLAWWPGEFPVGTKVVGVDALGEKVAETNP